MHKMRKGATFIEYALLAGLVAIVVAAAAMIFGRDLKALFGATGGKARDVSTQVGNVTFSLDVSTTTDAPTGGQPKT